VDGQKKGPNEVDGQRVVGKKGPNEVDGKKNK
jgi:hypothetical protein